MKEGDGALYVQGYNFDALPDDGTLELQQVWSIFNQDNIHYTAVFEKGDVFVVIDKAIIGQADSMGTVLDSSVLGDPDYREMGLAEVKAEASKNRAALTEVTEDRKQGEL